MEKNEVHSICIGGFDGMHLGHIRLFSELCGNGALVVIQRNASASLTPAKARQKYTKLPCFFYNLSEISHLSGAEFVEILKRDFINLRKIVVGYDFKFGKNRSCGAHDLKALFDGEVVIIDEVRCAGVGVHSSIIKKVIQDGDVTEAARLLGRRYCICGEVVAGQGIGAKELVATINFTAPNYILPRDGIYATTAKIDSKSYPSVTFIGKRFSTDMRFSIETHIIGEFTKIGFSQIEVCFVKFIRENAKFENLDGLKVQILADIDAASEILKADYER